MFYTKTVWEVVHGGGGRAAVTSIRLATNRWWCLQCSSGLPGQCWAWRWSSYPAHDTPWLLRWKQRLRSQGGKGLHDTSARVCWSPQHTGWWVLHQQQPKIGLLLLGQQKSDASGPVWWTMWYAFSPTLLIFAGHLGGPPHSALQNVFMWALMWKSAQHSKHIYRKLSFFYIMTFWSWGDTLSPVRCCSLWSPCSTPWGAWCSDIWDSVFCCPPGTVAGRCCSWWLWWGWSASCLSSVGPITGYQGRPCSFAHWLQVPQELH